MVNYEKLYKVLFNGMTDALRDMERQDLNSARFTLLRAQQDAEEVFMSDGGEAEEEADGVRAGGRGARGTDTRPRGHRHA